MSANVLGARKTHRISQETGLPVLRALVWSHCQSGRWAYLTIGWTRTVHHHRHAWCDRRDQFIDFDPNGPHNDSCRLLFPEEMLIAAALTAQRELARVLTEKP